MIITKVRKRTRLIYGVGYNGDFRSPYYNAWAKMLERCYSAKKRVTCPTYVGCLVAEPWLNFCNFSQWMHTQDWEGKHLDKDLLFMGNKIYSENTCVFIPERVNYFLTTNRARRGDLPIGVSRSRGKFLTMCRNPITGKKQFLGRFDTPEEAHLAWKAAKHEFACQLAAMETDSRIIHALRTRYAPNSNWFNQ